MKILKKLTQTVAIPIIDAAIDFIPDSDPRKPLFKAVWYSVRGGYGFLAEFIPEEADDFMKQIGKHRDEITTELLQSKEFEQALIITFDSLIRTRNVEKRTIVKRIFFEGYIPSENHETFELERFYQISQQITLEAVDYLRFIKRDILPRKMESVESKMKVKYKNMDIRPPEEMNQLLREELDSNHIRAWINEEFNYKSPKVKKRYHIKPNVVDYDPILAIKIENIEKEQIKKLEENASELTSLGIFRTIPTYDFTGYILSDFGIKYLEYLDKD